MLQPLRYSVVGLRTRLHATGGQPATRWSQRLATAAFPAANREPCEDDTSWGHSNEDTQTFQFENRLHFFKHLQIGNDNWVKINSVVISDLVPEWFCGIGEIGRTDSRRICWVQVFVPVVQQKLHLSYCSTDTMWCISTQHTRKNYHEVKLLQ